MHKCLASAALLTTLVIGCGNSNQPNQAPPAAEPKPQVQEEPKQQPEAPRAKQAAPSEEKKEETTQKHRAM
jgi:hypothetical protein